jgi:NAD-dependent deacetylase
MAFYHRSVSFPARSGRGGKGLFPADPLILYASRMDESVKSDIGRAAATIGVSEYVIALVGAGISVESGIPPFRGPGGLWTRHGEPAMNQWDEFMADPRAWWQRRMMAQGSGAASNWDSAQPNPAHYALAELEAMGVMKHVVTQNIDNLHQVAGTKSITEFHGNRLKLRCVRCEARYERTEFELSLDEPPACKTCNGIVKSDTVMFGEPIPRYAIVKSLEEARRADCILIIGTSAVVYPAAELPLHVHRRGGSLIEINPMETPLTDICDVALRGPAGEVVPALVEAVRRQRQ